jgi:hypothetical protein
MPQAIEFWPLKLLSKIFGVYRDSISQSGSCLGSVRVHSFTLSYTPKSMWCDSQASSWPVTLQPFCLGRKPKARVATLMLLILGGGQIKLVFLNIEGWKSMFFLILILDNQLWPSIIHSFQLLFAQLFFHLTHACFLPTTRFLC